MEPRARCSSAASRRPMHTDSTTAAAMPSPVPRAWTRAVTGQATLMAASPGIAHALAHEHPVHDGVDAGEGKGDDGGEHIAPEISLDHERGLLRLLKDRSRCDQKEGAASGIFTKIRVFLCLKQKVPDSELYI